MQIAISHAALRSFLFWCVASLVAAGFCVEVFAALPGGPEVPAAALGFFGLSYEGNLPTWFSTCLLFSCAALLALVALARQQEGARFTGHWRLLCVIFLYVSLDEFVSIHEWASAWFDLGGLLYFSWVIPAAVLLALLGLAYLPFLAHLPPRVRKRFLVAAIVYVGGALGMELPLGYWTDLHGDENFVYSMIDLVEEAMEMIGASLFLYALSDLLSGTSGELRLSLGTPAEASVTAVLDMRDRRVTPVSTDLRLEA